MNDRDVAGVIDRNEFDALCATHLLPRLLVPIQSVLAAANVAKESLFSIEVVGGSVRIPCVQKSLSDFFGRDVSKTCDGDESVARGSALMCAMISPSFKVKEFEGTQREMWRERIRTWKVALDRSTFDRGWLTRVPLSLSLCLRVVHDVTQYPIDLQWGPVPASGQEFKPDDSTALFTANNPIPSVKLISFNDRTEAFQLVARYAATAQLPPGTDPVIGRFIVSGMPGKVEGKKGQQRAAEFRDVSWRRCVSRC